MAPGRFRMVEWYSPRLLIQAGVDLVVSTVFGLHADQRTIQSLMGPRRYHDYSTGKRRDVDVDGPDEDRNKPDGAPPESFWLDYVADVGDGWNSTYSIAYALTRPLLSVMTDGKHNSYDASKDAVNSPATYDLNQGRVLIFGGDQVYPLAGRDEYDRRFIAPYAAAWHDGQVHSPVDVYAIPGNHDWFDSLRSFSRIFCTSTPFLPPSTGTGNPSNAETCTPQNRSYFAIRLPHNWWLLATDVQLGADIDGNQLEYFRAVCRRIGENDRVIVCNAEPHWLRPKKAQKRTEAGAATILDQLERDLLGDRVVVFLAGDVHHYMRYTSVGVPQTVHKITAGGGGAFLHPTHRTWDKTFREASQGSKPAREFTQVVSSVFPPPRDSQAISMRNLAFVILNPRFGALTGLLYLVLALMMLPAFNRFQHLKAEREIGQRVVQMEKLVSELQALSLEVIPAAPTVTSGIGPLPKIARHDLSTTSAQLSLNNLPTPEAVKSFAEQIDVVSRANPPEAVADIEPRPTIDLNDPNDVIVKSEAIAKNRQSRIKQIADEYESVSEAATNAAMLQNKIGPTYVDRVGGDYRGPRNIGSQPKRSPELPLESSDKTSAADIPIANASEPDPSWPWEYLWAIAIQEAALHEPFQAMLAMLILVGCMSGFIMFTDIPNTYGRFFLGCGHAAVHWLAAYIITLYSAPLLKYAPVRMAALLATIVGVLAIMHVLTTSNLRPRNWRQLIGTSLAFSPLLIFILVCSTDSRFNSLMIAASVFIAGWVVGSFIVGLYLLLTHTVTGQHWNEAFSSLRCQDWKCFLRFHFDAKGQLTLYPIGLRHVCRRWVEKGEHVEPEVAQSLRPILIEGPIRLGDPLPTKASNLGREAGGHPQKK